MSLDLDLRLAPDARAPATARRCLEDLRSRVDDATVDEAILLVSELVTNAVRHADLPNGSTIRVQARHSPSTLRIDVVDGGGGFDPATLPSPNGRSGWGLWLLDRLATRWGVDRNDATRVWFELGLVSRRSQTGT
jgi:signal transduction histidine kinase